MTDWPEMREGTLQEGAISASMIEQVSYQDDAQLGGQFWYTIEGREGRFSDHVYAIPVEILARHMDLIKSQKLKDKVLAWVNEGREARAERHEAEAQAQDKERNETLEKIQRFTVLFNEAADKIAGANEGLLEGVDKLQKVVRETFGDPEEEKPEPLELSVKAEGRYYVIRFGSAFECLPPLAVGPHTENPNVWQVFNYGDGEAKSITPFSTRRIKDLRMAIRIALGGMG